MKQNIRILPLAGLLLLFVAACGLEEENGAEESERVRLVPVETIVVVPDAFDDYIRLTGIVEAVEDAVISSEHSGRILTIVERGTAVQEGEMIARLDDQVSQAQFAAARTSYDLAEDTFHRMEALYADSIISTQDLNGARAQRDQARAQLDQAEKQLRNANITAPFSGRVEERMVRSGELVNPGVPVARLVNSSSVRITTGIPERYSGQIREGSPAVIRFRASGDEMNSEITFAGNLIDPATRTFPVEIELENQNERYKPEMVADISVQRETIQDAVVIPRAALLRDEEGTFVFVTAEENGHPVARLVQVTTGTASGAVIEIHDGLSEGDEVVITGLSNLGSGDRLNILSTAESNTKAREIQRNDRPSVSN